MSDFVVGRRVRVRQSTDYHTGSAGTIIEELGSDGVMVSLGEGCVHAFIHADLDLIGSADPNPESAPTAGRPSHRYTGHMLSFLEDMSQHLGVTDGWGLNDAGLRADFAALREHVKGNLA